MEIKQIIREPRISPSYCYDDCIATYAFGKFDYEISYIDSLRMEYSSNLKSVADGIIISYDINQSLLKYAKVKSIYLSNRDDTLKIGQIVSHMKENKSVLASMNGKSCPWDWRFNEEIEGVHVLFLSKIVKNSFQCIDPFYGVKSVITFDVLLEALTSVRILERKDTRMYSLKDFKKEIINTIQSNKIESFKSLAQDIKNNFILENEIVDFEKNREKPIEIVHNNMKINVKLKEFIHNLYRFSLLIRKYSVFSNCENKILSIMEEFEKTIFAWESIRFQLLKMLYSRRYRTVCESVGNKVSAVVDEMLDILDKLLQLFLKNDANSKNMIGFTKNNYNIIDKNIKEICLKKYFNNKALLSQKYEYDFDGLGNGIVDDCFFGETTELMFDNISCLSQILEFNDSPLNVKQISLVV